MTTTRLPTESLADLIEMAISDGRALDRAKYMPHAGRWHSGTEPLYESRCLVCLAGGVMAGTLDVDRERELYPNAFAAEPAGRVLVTLDAARKGHWTDAYRKLEHHNRADYLREWERRNGDMPEPVHCGFFGWEDFDVHLESLEGLLPRLREFEAEVPASA
ncbi:MAG: hypothetical protein OXC14_18415 [Rhodospirillaceae bacterium]|nr:hypothetical protein [Rhodospirillaceae bacterium]